MFRESLLDSALNRLSCHFGTHLVVRPPASAGQVAELERIVGPLPREFEIFLLTCNGLRIGDECNGGLYLWHVEEIMAALVAPAQCGMPDNLLPVRGDPVGERDWLVCGHGPAEGGVIRCDPWARGADFLSSDFGCYLDGWARYLTTWLLPDGRAVGDPKKRPPLNARVVGEHDQRLWQRRRDPSVVRWLADTFQTVACGDDFE